MPLRLTTSFSVGQLTNSNPSIIDDTKKTTSAAWLRARLPWALGLLIAALVYVGFFQWSPSSYGIALAGIGATSQRPDIGKPRPIRSDEWAVVTPLTQASVRNGFERINKASLYEEDLRINYGVPLWDWGAVFKPTLLGFFVLDPATAYSLHWFCIMALFLGGHALLFARLGLAPGLATLLSICLYYTGYTQFWWNEKGPVFAFFPWIILSLLAKQIPIAGRLVLCYWLTASWLITNLYPPVAVSLAFVGALFVLGWGSEWRRPRHLALLAMTAAASAGTVALYLWDYLRKTSATVYPGQRNAGGGSVPWQEAVSYFFPFSTFDSSFESVIGQNICEVGTGATALALLVLCFLDYRQIGPTWRHADATGRLQTWLLGIGLAAMAAWMLLPLPAWSGKLLLWNNVQPERMEYAFGVLLAFALVLLLQRVGVVFQWRRVFAFTLLVAAGWLLLKSPLAGGTGRSRTLNDFIVLLAAVPAIAAWRKGRLQGGSALLAASAMAGFLAVGGFNPLQSARPIFAQHDTPLLRKLAEEQAHNGGVLAFSGLPGAVQNGLGFRAVSHVTAAPALAFWRARYPGMPESEFMEVFNRYSHISLIGGDRPRLLSADNVGVPIQDFLPNRLYLPQQPPTATGKAPAWLLPGQNASGALTVPKSGKLQGFGIFIGNGAGSSDGRLVLSLCRGKDCMVLSRTLQGSLDNAYLELPLSSAIDLTAGDRIDYTMQLDGAARPLAFWAYPLAPTDAASANPSMTIDVSPAQAWIPQFDLRFDKPLGP
jgi:hypothetical protein